MDRRRQQRRRQPAEVAARAIDKNELARKEVEGTTRTHLMWWAANGKKDGAAPFEEDGCDTFVTDPVAACTIATAGRGNTTELTQRLWVCGSAALWVGVLKTIQCVQWRFCPTVPWCWAGDQKSHLV